MKTLDTKERSGSTKRCNRKPNYKRKSPKHRMGIKCECDCDFRFKNNRCITAFFLTLGFTLSFLSDLDCLLVRVDIGFVPNNSFFDGTSIGIGLWTFEDPDDFGSCITPISVSDIGGLTNSDRLYSSMFANGDVFWTTARILASIGLFVGFLSMVRVEC